MFYITLAVCLVGAVLYTVTYIVYKYSEESNLNDSLRDQESESARSQSQP
jgi:Na+/H+ antiporter NhaC